MKRPILVKAYENSPKTRPKPTRQQNVSNLQKFNEKMKSQSTSNPLRMSTYNLNLGRSSSSPRYRLRQPFLDCIPFEMSCYFNLRCWGGTPLAREARHWPLLLAPHHDVNTQESPPSQLAGALTTQSRATETLNGSKPLTPSL